MKVYVLLIFICFWNESISQNSKTKMNNPHLGINFGGGISYKLASSIGDNANNYTVLPDFAGNVGLNYKATIVPEILYFQTSLDLSKKGFKLRNASLKEDIVSQMSINLMLPMQLLVKRYNYFIGLGPYYEHRLLYRANRGGQNLQSFHLDLGMERIQIGAILSTGMWFKFIDNREVLLTLNTLIPSDLELLISRLSLFYYFK